nr:hypothetical protein [Tanacetum cinerariifolium]
MIGHSLDGYLDDLLFGVRVSGGSEAILHAVNRLIEGREDDVGLLMLMFDFKNAFKYALVFYFEALSACSRVFVGDIYGDHAVSCAGIIGIEHLHNVVRDTLVDICYHSEISAGKEVDIGLDGVIDAAQRKRGKYMAKCVAIGYGFLPFSFSSLGELEEDAVTLLKRIQKFSMAQDIRARGAIHIFYKISFAIARGVGAQIVSRLPSNLL